MKHLFPIIIILMLSATTAKASDNNNPGQTNNIVMVEDKAEAMHNRLKEIYAMDKSTLSLEQKHQLRNEVLNIQSNFSALQENGRPVLVISGAALLLIIILLIILL